MGNILGALPRVREARASGSIAPANPQKDVLVQPTDGIADIPVQYTFTNVEGAFTLEELVDMEGKKDARMQKVRIIIMVIIAAFHWSLAPKENNQCGYQLVQLVSLNTTETEFKMFTDSNARATSGVLAVVASSTQPSACSPTKDSA